MKVQIGLRVQGLGLLGLVVQVEVGQSRKDQQGLLEGIHRSLGSEELGVQEGRWGIHRSRGYWVQVGQRGIRKSQDLGLEVLVGVLGL